MTRVWKLMDTNCFDSSFIQRILKVARAAGERIIYYQSDVNHDLNNFYNVNAGHSNAQCNNQYHTIILNFFIINSFPIFFKKIMKF